VGAREQVSTKCGELLYQLSVYKLLKDASIPWNYR